MASLLALRAPITASPQVVNSPSRPPTPRADESNGVSLHYHIIQGQQCDCMHRWSNPRCNFVCVVSLENSRARSPAMNSSQGVQKHLYREELGRLAHSSLM